MEQRSVTPIRIPYCQFIIGHGVILADFWAATRYAAGPPGSSGPTWRDVSETCPSVYTDME